MVSVLCSVMIGLQTFKVRRRVRNVLMITVRNPRSIYQVDVPIDGGSCHGRWHFSFDRYYDPEWMRFGTLRVFNDDTLTPGAVWPLHPHREIEVVTYCAGGEFRHALVVSSRPAVFDRDVAALGPAEFGQPLRVSRNPSAV